MYGEIGERDLRFELAFEFRLDFAQRQTIHYIVFRQPAFTRDTDPEPQILETLDAVRVGIDHAFHSFFFGARPPTPVEIKPFRSGIELDPRPAFRRRIENCR